MGNGQSERLQSVWRWRTLLTARLHWIIKHTNSNCHFPARTVTHLLTPLESNEPGLELNLTVFRRARSFLSTLRRAESRAGQSEQTDWRPCVSLQTIALNHSEHSNTNKVLLLVLKCLNDLGPSDLSDMLLSYQPWPILRSSGVPSVGTKTLHFTPLRGFGTACQRTPGLQRLLMFLRGGSTPTFSLWPITDFFHFLLLVLSSSFKAHYLWAFRSFHPLFLSCVFLVSCFIAVRSFSLLYCILAELFSF